MMSQVMFTPLPAEPHPEESHRASYAARTISNIPIDEVYESWFVNLKAELDGVEHRFAELQKQQNSLYLS